MAHLGTLRLGCSTENVGIQQMHAVLAPELMVSRPAQGPRTWTIQIRSQYNVMRMPGKGGAGQRQKVAMASVQVLYTQSSLLFSGAPLPHVVAHL